MAIHEFARKIYVRRLFELGISPADIAVVLEVDRKVVLKDLRIGATAAAKLPEHGDVDRYASVYVAALFCQLKIMELYNDRLIAHLGSLPNPRRLPMLQERICAMQDDLVAAQSRVDKLENALITVQGAANSAIGENRPRKWNEALYRRVDSLDLSVRAITCLQNAKIEFVWDLCEKKGLELLQDGNFGRKSLNEIKDILADLGLSLGMDLSGFPGKNT